MAWSGLAQRAFAGAAFVRGVRGLGGSNLLGSVRGYIGTQALISGIETGVEYLIAQFTGGDFDVGITFLKNFAINLVTGKIGGGANWLIKGGLWAGRQGIEIGMETGFDVLIMGRDLRTSLLWNTVASVGGETLLRGVLLGGSKAIGRIAHSHSGILSVFQPRARQLADFFGIEACFAAGTMIMVPNWDRDLYGHTPPKVGWTIGWRAIELIRKKDWVLSRDENNRDAALVPKQVEQVFKRLGHVGWLSARGREIGTTSEHPFYEARSAS